MPNRISLKKILNNRGMAIIITLTVITLLMALTFELNRRARSDISLVAAARDRITLTHMTTSGLHLTFAVLIKDKKDTETDSLQEDWADPEKLQAFAAIMPFDEGKITLSISDELSRIQVNALVDYPEGHGFDNIQMLLWERFLTTAFKNVEPIEDMNPVITVLSSMKDWLDFGDDDAITGLSGAESEYYQDLDPPYSCRNGPVKFLDELLRVKGIIPELYTGTKEIPGISNYLTVYGISDIDNNRYTYPGKININTAEIPVMMALLPEENQDLAPAIAEYRLDRSGDTYTNNLSGHTWYRNVPGCGDITINPDLITSATDLFRVEIIAELHAIKLYTTAVIKRIHHTENNKYTCKVLSWRQEQ